MHGTRESIIIASSHYLILSVIIMIMLMHESIIIYYIIVVKLNYESILILLKNAYLLHASHIVILNQAIQIAYIGI